MKKRFKKGMAIILSLVLLIGCLPISFFPATAAAEKKPTYKVEIVSYIRGLVKDLRCSELLEARIYKSVDDGDTWEAVTDVDGTHVSKLTYTWTNTSANTSMVVYFSHNMADVGLYGDTAEGTFKDGVSSTAVGAQWAAYKTPGYDVVGGFGGGFWPGSFWPGGSGSGSSSTSKVFAGTATVQVSLPDGTVLTDSCSDFGAPNLEADLNNIALGLFIGESTTFLDLLAESGIVHINCSRCSVSNIKITDNDGVITYTNGKVIGSKMGETSISMTVSKVGCTVHNGQTADVSTKAFVFKKPTTSTTTTTLTLAATSLDERCRYFINGVEGTKQTDGSILFSGLDPDKKYTVDVVATYTLEDNGTSIVRYAYAYVSDTTKPMYVATVNTYLNGLSVDLDDIHGEDVVLYIKAENGEYIPLTHRDTGVYATSVDNGIYYVYHLEEGGYHQINDNPLIISNAPASTDIHHYSVSYDAAGGSFQKGETPKTVNYASGKEVLAISNIPAKDGYVFAGWRYGQNTYFSGDVITDGISSEIVLVAQWERMIDVFINVTIDHTYIDKNGNVQTDVNDSAKDQVEISLVARNNSNSPYLEVDGCDLSLNETSHNGHRLYVDGTQVNSYAGLNAEAIKKTVYDGNQTAAFTGLSGAKDYFVTVEKAGYDATVTARKTQNGDWVIDVSLKFNPTSLELEFEVNMDSSVPQELYPKAAIVKILYFDEADNTWKIITQHSNGNPGVRVEIEKQTGNKGSYPVWSFESESGKAYGYRIMVSAFVYADGTIVPVEEDPLYTSYTDKKYTATIGTVSDGAKYGSLNGAYFSSDAQVGTLNAVISLESYRVTFDAMGGTVNGNATQTVGNQYYIPAFDAYTPVMEGHTFLGWWYKDTDGKYTKNAKDGVLLTENVTLYALWDQTLTGSLSLPGTYMLNGEEVSIWESDRATEVIVVLQEIASDSVNTIDYQTLSITWNGNNGQSEKYLFTKLNPIKQYRLNVLLTNYTTQYQNSTTAAGSFNAQDYGAVYQESDPWNTFVNGKLSFNPESYYQSVKVDSTHIGSDFRPDEVKTEIWYTERNTDNEYKIISQHTASGGILVKLDANGNTNGKFGENVWKQNFNGHLYDYILKVSDSHVLNLPVSIVYGPGSHFETVQGTEKNALTATLIPNTYSITYDLNTDADDDIYVVYDAHTWSFETEITYTPTRQGYVFKGWSANDRIYENGKVKATVSEDVTLVAIWEKADYAYTVEYYYDDVLKQVDQKTAKYLDVINTEFANRAVFQSQSYALDQVIGQPLVIGTDVSANVIKVYYATDKLSDTDDDTNTPDGIPDKYQAVVTFNIVNGTWNDANAAKPRVYTLYEKDADGVWSKLPSVAFGTTPVGTAVAGFENKGKWSPQIPDTVDRSATYTLSFNNVLNYTVTIIVENGTGNIEGQSTSFDFKTVTVAHGNDISLKFDATDGFALDYIAVDGVVTTANGTQLNDWDSHRFENIEEDRVIRVVYSKDTVGGGNDSEESDDVPDKYQKKVVFKVINGTWDGTNDDDIVKYVTLLKDGKWDMNGSADMPEIPVNMKANTGYKKGAWDVTSFPTTLSGTDTVTYTHTFKPTAYVDYIYYIEHYKQLPNGVYALAERERYTLRIELNADENDFENAHSAISAIAKNYGVHFSENTTHSDRKVSGTPKYGELLTLKLFYALDSHTVKYNLNGGNAVSGVNYSDTTLLCGNNVTVQVAPHRTGYTFEGWLSDSGDLFSAYDVFTLNADVTLTAQWERQTGLSYTVHYFEENTNQVIKPEKHVGGMTFEDVVSSRSEVLTIDGYLFAYADPTSLTIGINNSQNVINLYYTPDRVGGGDDGDDSDNIPDKYQKKVIFKVVNGTWDGTNSDDITRYVTLLTNGEWDINGSATVNDQIVPTGMKANTGFKNGAWDATFPVTVSGIDDVTFTYSFDRGTTPVTPSDTVKYMVEHYKANNDGSYPTDPTEMEIFSGKIGDTVTATEKSYDGYCLNLKASGTVRSATLVAIKTADNIVVLKLYYDFDRVGGGDDGDDSDNIPDKYQKKVIFKVVNGTWDGTNSDDIIRYVTLLTNGEWDVNGSDTVNDQIVPTGMTANTGFKNGAWDVTFPVTVNGTDDVTFTYSFDRSTTPVTPGDTVKYMVEHYKANNDGSYPTDPTETEVFSGKIGDTVTATEKSYDGYCLNLKANGTVRSATLVAIETADNIVVLKLYYDFDRVGGDDGDESDNIPDKYQKKVIFKVVNGTWDGTNCDDIIRYVTLLTDGEWNVNGSATVNDQIVPTGMMANTGFKNGAWDATFPVTVSGTDDVTYTFSFGVEETPNPETGYKGNFLLWFTVMFASAAALCHFSLYKHKKAVNNK